MAIKKITVTKDNVTKKIDADLEKDYVKNGWVVEKENPYEPTQYPFNVRK